MNSLEIDLVYGLVGILLYWFRNPDKTFLNWISILVFILFLSQVIFFYFSVAGQITWIVSSLGLVVIYSIRFRRKNRTRIDYLKPFGLLLLIVYQVPFYSFIAGADEEFWMTLRLSTFFIVGTIFVYDRWILKSEVMKKGLTIILIVQSVVILLVLVYAFVQKSEADKQFRIAEKQRSIAEQNAEMARAMFEKPRGTAYDTTSGAVAPVLQKKPSIIVLPPFDEIANEGISPDVQKYLEREISKDTSVALIKFPYKSLMSVPYHNVFDKKYCAPITDKVDVDIVIMTKLEQTKRTGQIPTDGWDLWIRIYNVKTDHQVNSKVIASNLSEVNISKFLELRRQEFMAEIKNNQ